MSEIVVVGDAMLDIDVTGVVSRISPEAPVPVVDVEAEHTRAGGAALAAHLAAQDGHSVTLVTALADDAEAERLRILIEARVRLVAIGRTGTTTVKRRVRVEGQTVLRLDSGTDGAVGAVPDNVADLLAGADAVLVSDYGRGVCALPPLRAELARRARDRPMVWDPHPRGADPVPAVQVVTPNLDGAMAHMARHGRPVRGSGVAAAAACSDALMQVWDVGAVAVTMGARGAVLSTRMGAPSPVFSVPAVRDGDRCGAGDRFAASVAGWLAHGATLAEAASAAVQVAAEYVADGGAAAVANPDVRAQAPVPADAAAVVAAVRARRGVVVATGGCFDLLHPGHLATLAAARRLGDCLVVLLNSDASVRRIKGSSRPLIAQRDRAAVLTALEHVDAVIVFDADTPDAALRALRPDVWAKGGDYAGRTLPEMTTLAEWGGRTVVLPLVAGHSTTQLVAQAAGTGARNMSP